MKKMRRSLFNNYYFKEARFMKNTPKNLKVQLDSSIANLVSTSRLFVRNPDKDFTRKRSLPLSTVIEILLSLGGNSLNKELLSFFNYNSDVVSSSAFVQQRSKLLSEALGFLLIDFVDSVSNLKTYNGYRFLAVDGTGTCIPKNPLHPGTYVKKQDNNQIHITALYDLCNKIYTDAEIQVIKEKNEFKALVNMVDRSNIAGPVILTGDRGFASYNNIAHLESKGWKYLIRTKSPNSRNSSFSKLNLPLNQEFDCDIKFELTRRQTKEIRSNKEKYRLLINNSTFDYLEKGSKGTYPIHYRAVCVEVEHGKFQYFITNLDGKEFPKEKVRDLYKKRWGVETSFRELKYALGLTSFHSKKVDLIKQEIYAKMVMYNYCELITLNIIITQKPRKHTYQVNFTMAIHICKQYFLKFKDADPPDVEALIQKYILPIREDRIYPRKVKNRSRISFLYRVA